MRNRSVRLISGSEIQSLIDEAVEDERARILELLQAHKSWFPEIEMPGVGKMSAYCRILNLISAGTDLAEEMKLPPEERAFGFHWPDE